MCVPVPGGIRQPGILCQGVIRPTPLILGALVGLAYLRFPERIVRISGRHALRRDEIIANFLENERRNRENGCAGPIRTELTPLLKLVCVRDLQAGCFLKFEI